MPKPLNDVIDDLGGRGFAVEIEDRDVGIDEAAMAELNAKLADGPWTRAATLIPCTFRATQWPLADSMWRMRGFDSGRGAW